jgi:RimJ/RimL family protein N-acetyltransferase
MFRREFREFKNLKRTEVPIAKRILITLGGSDPHNTGAKILQSLRQALDSYEAVVVAGTVNPFFSDLEDEATHHARSSLNVLARVSDMAKQMAWADMAVSAAGTTSYELAFMGLPALMVIAADNQRKNADALDAFGISSCLGWHENVTVPNTAKALRELAEDSGRRELMGQRGRQLVDGDGVDRVQALLRGQRVRLRPVSGNDRRLLWDWVNDPVVRTMSFSSHLISWEEHQTWFDARLTDPACRLYIAVDAQDRPVGHIRFEPENEEITASIIVSPDFRGKGYGKEILKIAAEKMMATSSVKVIRGFVKKTNEASLKAFTGAGFFPVAEVEVRGHKSVHFELARRAMP